MAVCEVHGLYQITHSLYRVLGVNNKVLFTAYIFSTYIVSYKDIFYRLPRWFTLNTEKKITAVYIKLLFLNL